MAANRSYRSSLKNCEHFTEMGRKVGDKNETEEWWAVGNNLKGRKFKIEGNYGGIWKLF